MLAGADGNALDQAAVPFWYLCLLIGVAWILNYRMRRHNNQRILLMSAVPFLVLYLLLLRISPAVYGSMGASFFDFSWLTGQAATVSALDIQPFLLIVLFALVVYLWLRGAALALRPETSITLSLRFAVYLAALMIAVLSLNAMPSDVRAPDTAALTLLIIGEVFFGLVGAALARLAAQRRDQHDTARSDDARWIGSALLVALGVVIVALFASLIFGFDSFLAFLGYLGPIGIAIGTVLTWFVNLTGQLAAALSNLIHLTPPAKHAPTQQPNISLQCVYVKINGKLEVRCIQSHTTTAPGWIQALVIVGITAAVLAIVSIILYFVINSALARYRHTAQPEEADEREALDGRSLFAEQVRGLLDRFGQRVAPERDPLQRGTVRYMYRDVLRSAKSRGLERAPAETPDEYAGRLTRTAPLAARATGESDDFLVLSDAYNGARYADREPDAPTRASLQDRARRLIRLFGG